VVVEFLAVYRAIHPPFGQVLKAIRENEQRATSLGYRVDRYKLMAFVPSAGIAGLAGSTKSIVFQLASLTDVQRQMSGEVVPMTLVGGMGTVIGPAVGAAVIVAMQDYLASTGEWVSVIQGVIFVVAVLAFRRGIVGEIAARLPPRWLGGEARPASPATLPLAGPAAPRAPRRQGSSRPRAAPVGRGQTARRPKSAARRRAT
jgi:branched-chain amino acid transport system permease protein